MSDDGKPMTDAPATLGLLGAIAERPLVLDAAMGTRLIARGLDLNHDDPGLWNLTHPDEVLAIHRRDVATGADVLVANTFGLNLPWLKRSGNACKFRQANERAVQLAREAAGINRFVIGGIGPMAVTEPGSVRHQAAVLIERGADALLLETYRDDTAIAALIELRGEISTGVPIIVSLWQWPEDCVPVARRVVDLGASILGMNCQPGVQAAIGFVNRLAGVVTCPLFVKPSVDSIENLDCTPAAFAGAVPALVGGGARLLGGCCGTTEEHVAALAGALRFDAKRVGRSVFFPRSDS
jgi:5-methyltetrahydrofolate--homocysteine methyltransferase